jgi:metal-dependent amidase/aminoacylase/carboxypeptidase family protein
MDAKVEAQKRCDELRNDLIALSHRIHAHPELGHWFRLILILMK